MLATLLNLFGNYKETCSITEVRDGCVTFARDTSYFKYLTPKDAWVIVPNGSTPFCSIDKGIKFFPTKYPEYEFTLFHNYIYRDMTPKEASIGNRCKIHSTVIMDVDGLKVINTSHGDKIQFKHTGEVVIGNDVEIGPYTVIHRGTLGFTRIGDGCKFGALNNIGHNCNIGDNTVIAVGAILNGGVEIGKNCWISSGVKIKHYAKVCDNVVIGLGSVVIEDITEPGIYVGTPCKFLKPVEEGWNF